MKKLTKKDFHEPIKVYKCKERDDVRIRERSIKKDYIILSKESLVYSGCILLPKTIIHNGGVASAGMVVKDTIPAMKIAFNGILKDRKEIL